MENHQQKSSSGENFSFPIVPVDDRDKSFEFGSVTQGPGSPNSPADHLFFNGRLLPHAFPCQPTNISPSFSRSTSRTSSISSKDSFMSSRSNSINSSRSSSCSSARTSTSEAASSKGSSSTQAEVSRTSTVSRDRQYHCYQAKKPAVLSPHCSSSQRWQFITPAPALKHQNSRTRKTQTFDQQELKQKKKTKDWTNANTWFGWRLFKSFVSACKECHSIKPSSTKCVAKE